MSSSHASRSPTASRASGLPMASDISRLVSVDLPPKKRRVSQQSVIVCAESSYVAFSWESDCRMIEQEMLRLRTTAMVRSKSGTIPMLANSSRMKCTGVGEASAKSQKGCVAKYVHRLPHGHREDEVERGVGVRHAREDDRAQAFRRPSDQAPSSSQESAPSPRRSTWA